MSPRARILSLLSILTALSSAWPLAIPSTDRGVTVEAQLDAVRRLRSETSPSDWLEKTRLEATALSLPNRGITNIKEFLDLCPNNDVAFPQINQDFKVRRNGTLAPTPVCSEPVSKMPVAQYTDELIVLQGLRVIYYMDRGQRGHLPWTMGTLYDWMKSKIGGINLVDGSGSYCCVQFDGRTYIAVGTQDEFNREFDKAWRGISGNIGLYAHETRHVDGFLHVSCCGITFGCDQTFDISNISAYGTQWWLDKLWLEGGINVGYSCLTPTEVREIADWHQSSTDGFRARFCSNLPSLVKRPDVPGGNCSSEPGPVISTLFVPIVLTSFGLSGSFFTSEMTMTNRGSQDATLSFTYTAAFGGGSGTASDALPAGRQRIVQDAISYLRSIGLPIPDSGNRGGTLAVRANPGDVGVSVRTTTVVPEGRAGLSYPAIPVPPGLKETVYLCGLRQTAQDRSNVAIQNAGSTADGEVVLRLTVFSGDPAKPASLALPDENLSPGEFRQISGILASNGLELSNGYVSVQRISGTAPFYAYAVVNDQANSDGSFVPPVREVDLAGRSGLTLPVIVETSSFSSELVATNFSSNTKLLRFTYVADNIPTPDSAVRFNLSLAPGQQILLPNVVQYLRQNGIGGLESANAPFVGALFATVEGGDVSGIFLGARTSAPGGGGRYGLFYVAVPQGAASTTSVWLYGLQQNSENRTNLALVNTGEANNDAIILRIELFDGATGTKVNTLEVILNSKHWAQIGSILAVNAPGVTQGYARVTRIAGLNSFIAYAVINDGAGVGERSGDGAFIASSR